MGEGPRGSNGTCSTLCGFSVTSSATYNQIGPFWCWFLSGWARACSRPLWVSPLNSPMRLGVSPAAASTPTVVFNQRFEALFPGAGALGCAVCCASPPFLPVYVCANVGLQGLPATTLWGLLAAAWPVPFHNPLPRWVCHSPPCRKSSPPGLPVPALPTGLDECFFFIFLVVRLPYSSIFCQFWLFFLFLNCCCLYFGCEIRHIVSTYVSILAGTSSMFLRHCFF